MPYRFTFDLSKLSRFFFEEMTRVSYQKGIHKKIGETAQAMIKKFKIQESTGLSLSEAVTLLQDFIDLNARNITEKDRFSQVKKKALFLPHCSRKYMDSRCKSTFDPNIPSYICAACSKDCLINKATFIAKKKGYDVYVVPGGSCIPKILRSKGYEGALGVACGEEARLSGEMLEKMGVAGQAVPLIKNGCANTIFEIETLVRTL